MSFLKFLKICLSVFSRLTQIVLAGNIECLSCLKPASLKNLSVVFRSGSILTIRALCFAATLLIFLRSMTLGRWIFIKEKGKRGIFLIKT